MASLDDIVSGAAGAAEVEIDFSGAVDFDPLPKGEYRAKVLAVKPDTAKSSGAPKLVWTFGVDDPAFPQFAGRQLFRHTPTTGKGSGLAKQVMKALGFPVEGERVSFKPSAAVGRSALLVVGIQKDNDAFNEITRVKPADGASGSFPA